MMIIHHERNTMMMLMMTDLAMGMPELAHTAKIAQNGLVRLLIEFNSLYFVGNGLKQSILWWSNIGHHSHIGKILKLGP